MKQKVKTIPYYDPNSIPTNVEYKSWFYNVEDRFKDKSNEEIIFTLRATAFPYAICMENLTSDFNFSTLVRNANAFNARKVYYLGNRKWDKRGATGAYNYTDIEWLSCIEDFIELKKDYTIVGLDNIEGSVSINKFEWQPNTLMVFGSESYGISPELQKLCDAMVYIEQFGSIRSLNVGTASGIAMNDFVSKYRTTILKNNNP